MKCFVYGLIFAAVLASGAPAIAQEPTKQEPVQNGETESAIAARTLVFTGAPLGSCSFARPPAWPSFCFEQMNEEALHQLTLTRNGKPVVDLPEGVIVLGWLGTSMPDTPLHEWVYTRGDRSVSSRLLHGDALARLYTEVEAWLAKRKAGR